jgi:large subunit ribosomal protein L6|tara:strand:- start:33 stop:587 length:555 start_codon:yes stop_codon:yes gene_type:complete
MEKMQINRVSKVVTVPENVEANLTERIITMQGPKGNLSRSFFYPEVTIQLDKNSIVISTSSNRKRQRAMVGTFFSHIRNMIIGITQGFTCKMKVVYSHFPMSVKVLKDEIVIDNYLGEKISRKTKIVGSCKVSIKGSEIVVSGIDKETVGQTVANIEKKTRVKKRDSRVFQDGIYLIERDGVKI